MPLLFVVVLAVVQGITEFLPISSSGHLEITWRAMEAAEVEMPEDGSRLVLFVAAHVGSLLAVMLYFWRDVWALVRGLLRLFSGRGGPEARLLGAVVVGSLPLIAVGFLVKDGLIETVYSLPVVAWATLGFGLLLLLADRLGMTVRRTEHLGLVGAFVIGLAQCLALIPGTSRAGITMTAARFMGFERAEAARFSLLLSIPAILGAGAVEGFELYRMGSLQLGLDAGYAAGLAFLSALLAIALMMAWLRRAGFTPFVVYRLLLGVVLLWIAHLNGMSLNPFA